MSLEIILKRLSNCFLKLESGFDYTPQGRLFLRNIENLWLTHCMTSSRYNVFLTEPSKYTKTLQNLRDANINSLPLGLVSNEISKISLNTTLFEFPIKSFPHNIARMITFNETRGIKDLFHKKQRERKTWWRKLAQYPSKFVLSEVKKVKNNEEINIVAQFPFGNIIVETITYQSDVRRSILQNQNDTGDTRDVKSIEHVAYLDWGCLALLCDSYTEIGAKFEFQIRPKIAPYKVVCLIDASNDDSDMIKEDLQQLVVHINDLLRKKGLCTLLTSGKDVREIFHVPLIISVDKSSLKTGIIKVTRQVTSLAELVHLSKLVDHVALYCT